MANTGLLVKEVNKEIVDEYQQVKFIAAVKEALVINVTAAMEENYAVSNDEDKDNKFPPVVATTEILSLKKQNRSEEQAKLLPIIRPAGAILNVPIAMMIEAVEEITLLIEEEDDDFIVAKSTTLDAAEIEKLKKSNTKNGKLSRAGFDADVHRKTLEKKAAEFCKILKQYESDYILVGMVEAISRNTIPLNSKLRAVKVDGNILESFLKQKVCPKTNEANDVGQVVFYVIDMFMRILGKQIANYTWFDCGKEAFSINVLCKILSNMGFGVGVVEHIKKIAELLTTTKREQKKAAKEKKDREAAAARAAAEEEESAEENGEEADEAEEPSEHEEVDEADEAVDEANEVNEVNEDNGEADDNGENAEEDE